tara:strand:- start:1442 stop:1594 length:153 start_codon:yes stop_codon:yes gene_type:complete
MKVERSIDKYTRVDRKYINEADKKCKTLIKELKKCIETLDRIGVLASKVE